MESRDSVFSILELLVLRALSVGPKHGWALAKSFQDGRPGEALQIRVSSLYSALHRLEQAGWIRARWLETGVEHRSVKFYFITPAAWARLEDEVAASCHCRRSPSLLHQSSTKVRLTAVAACSIAFGRSANAGDTAPPAVTSDHGFNVYVCLKLNGLSAPFELARAKYTASRILATASVSLEWHSYSSDGCRPLQKTRTVVLDFTRDTRPHIFPGALAYAKPFEGLHAVVMYDRIAENARKPIPIGTLLGHVMAHEITHLLQGVELHSDWGLMKARWTTRDFAQMMFQPLPLTPDDIGLIQCGPARRPSASNDGDVVHPGPRWD